MKKIIAAALLLLLVGTGAFALDWAVGGGLLFNYSRTLGTVDETYYYYGEEWMMSRQGFGGFAFLGLGRFWELNLGFLYKNPKTLSLSLIENGSEVSSSEQDISGVIDGTAALQFGLYFKYPFVISDMIVLFPTAGIDYELTLGSDWGWWDDLWFRGGAGVDIFFSQRMFLRAHFIYGVALLMRADDSIWGPDLIWADSKFGHGLLAKVGIGFMF